MDRLEPSLGRSSTPSGGFGTGWEADPARFFIGDLESLLNETRTEAAAFIGAPADGFAFVPNATVGVNIALRSAPLGLADELIVTDHG